jgi:hypothetical protein
MESRLASAGGFFRFSDVSFAVLWFPGVAIAPGIRGQSVEAGIRSTKRGDRESQGIE